MRDMRGIGGVRELENSIHLSFHIVVVFISSGCFRGLFFPVFDEYAMCLDLCIFMYCTCMSTGMCDLRVLESRCVGVQIRLHSS